MPKDHRLKTRKPDLTPTKTLPLNFLLGCSERALGDFELARLGDVADLRKELHVILDRVIDAMSQAALATWFKSQDRQTLKHAIENEETPLEWANRMIRNSQRTGEELLPLPSLPPGAAHLAAAKRYQERNIAEGKCQNCAQPLDPNSVRFCTKHLAAERMRKQPKGKKEPGSIDYLYKDDSPENRPGRQRGTLATLAMNREKKTRELLAELGVKPETAAITRRAAKEALLERMPNSSEEAKRTSELFLGLPTSDSLAKKALAELLSEGKVQRTGQGIKDDVYRYFLARG